MLLFNGLKPRDHRQPIKMGLDNRREKLPTFWGRHRTGLSFRNRLLMGTILFAGTYGLSITAVGSLLLQPRLLQQTFAETKAEDTQVAVKPPTRSVSVLPADQRSALPPLPEAVQTVPASHLNLAKPAAPRH